MKDIGLKLRDLIEHGNLTQAEIADRAGYSRSHFWQICQKPDMSCSMLEKICNAMNLDPSSFFETKAGAKKIVDTASVKVENNPTFTVNQASATSADVEHYKNLCDEKDKQIAILTDNVQLLKQLLTVYRDGIGTKQSQNAESAH